MIKIHREKEYNDQSREYEVMLDNKYLGSICSGETKKFDVSEGKHSIYIRLDWCKSNMLDFDISKKQIVNFQCGNFAVGWKRMFANIYTTFFKDKYLWIKTKSCK